jgi:hypothetical protein
MLYDNFAIILAHTLFQPMTLSRHIPHHQLTTLSRLLINLKNAAIVETVLYHFITHRKIILPRG